MRDFQCSKADGAKMSVESKVMACLFSSRSQITFQLWVQDIIFPPKFPKLTKMFSESNDCWIQEKKKVTKIFVWQSDEIKKSEKLYHLFFWHNFRQSRNLRLRLFPNIFSSKTSFPRLDWSIDEQVSQFYCRGSWASGGLSVIFSINVSSWVKFSIQLI